MYEERKKLQDLQKKYEQDTGKQWDSISDIEKQSSGNYFGF
jgi:hypothetical protein